VRSLLVPALLAAACGSPSHDEPDAPIHDAAPALDATPDAALDAAPDAGLDAAIDAAPPAVCGDDIVEPPEDCDAGTYNGDLVHQAAWSFESATQCSLSCVARYFGPLAGDWAHHGPATPFAWPIGSNAVLDLYANAWNPSTNNGYDDRLYLSFTLAADAHVTLYTMAEDAFSNADTRYDDQDTLYEDLELFTIYAADETTRVGGFVDARGNVEASPWYAAAHDFDLVAGTYYVAVSTPYYAQAEADTEAYRIYAYLSVP
jgi:hypothetical protein